MFGSLFTNISSSTNNFIKEIYIGNDLYNVKIEKDNDSSKILMSCNLKDDVISLFDYSLELSYDEFCKLGKSFRNCDDINEIYNLLKYLIYGLTISSENSSLNIKSILYCNIRMLTVKTIL